MHHLKMQRWMDSIFCKFDTKIWIGIDFSNDNYHIMNKILIKYCIIYYQKYWKYQMKYIKIGINNVKK